MLTARAIGIGFAILSCVACREPAKKQESADRPPPAAPRVEPEVPAVKADRFASAADAMAEILRRTAPTVIGFGEFHQLEGTSNTLSALERFRTELLPPLAAATSDLVVETWIPKNCGEMEEKAIAQVEEVSERPQETENETIRLIRAAEKAGVQPHILDVKCEEYESLFDENGEMDFLRMLELVGRLLKETGQNILSKRAAEPLPSRPRVLLYGGAIHNDLHFDPMWTNATFGPAMKAGSGGKYVAVDVYVPEFIENNSLVKEEPWYPVYRELVSDREVLLLETASDSFIIVFKRGVKNTPASGGGQP